MRLFYRSNIYYICLVFVCSFSSNFVYANEFPGGFIERPGDNRIRSLLTRTQIQDLLPDRGKFTFPAPYNTDAIRLTNAQDCNNSDCVAYSGYAYWSNINNHVGSDTMLIFLGMNRNKGGAGPSLIQYNKLSDTVRNLGPLFDASEPLSWATGEGWYFSASMPNALYVNSGAKLLRYDVSTKNFSLVFDVETLLGNGLYVWQAHSSADDLVHSVTVRDSGSYEMLGCMVYSEASGSHSFYPKNGEFDECQVDKSGKWLLIKENVDGINGEDNRIIELQTGRERILLDSAGAAGHSDMGYGYMVATDNWAAQPNTQKLWKFDSTPLEGTVVYSNTNWNVFAPAHVSHQNANADVPPENQIACGSSVNRINGSEANEIICFGLNGADKALVVAPVMTNLDANGGGNDYAKLPKGNLDVTGQYFLWTSNMGSDRLDAFIVKIPGQQLSNGGAVTSNSTPIGSQPLPIMDLIGPLQSAIDVHSITSDSALISWQTDEAAEDAVVYSLSGYESHNTPINTIQTTNHTVALTNLRPDSTYLYNAASRDASGNVSISEQFTFHTSAATFVEHVSPSPLTWTNLVNASDDGNTLTKSAGCNGCDDAGASSQQVLLSGDAYLEFTVNDTQSMRLIGLSKAIVGTTADQVDFALRIQNGYVEVREDSVYRADTTLRSGDVLRVGTHRGQIIYSRNGIVFYTSTQTPRYPIKAYARLYNLGSSIRHATTGE